jgi:hypothetical protein
MTAMDTPTLTPTLPPTQTPVNTPGAEGSWLIDNFENDGAYDHVPGQRDAQWWVSNSAVYALNMGAPVPGNSTAYLAKSGLSSRPAVFSVREIKTNFSWGGVFPLESREMFSCFLNLGTPI